MPERVTMTPAPDWSAGPVELELSFVTQIDPARLGDEQRTPGRMTPARVQRYVMTTMQPGELAAFRKLQAASQPLVTGLWTDGVTITAAVAAGGATAIATTSTAARRFRAGGQCLVFADAFTFSVCDVTAVGALSVTVNSIDRAFAAGDRLYPAFAAEPLGQTQGTMQTDCFAGVTLELLEEMDAALPAAAAADWDSYLDIPLFALPMPDADWSTSPTDASTIQLLRNIYGYGRREIVIQEALERVSQTFTARMFDAAAALRLESFFRDRLGRCQPFWWADLVPLAAVVSVAGSTITLRAVDYATWFAPLGACRSYLAIVDATGAVHAFHIVSVVDNDDGTETYTLDSAVGISAGAIARVSFLLLMRFDQDVLILQYVTDSIASAQIALLEVPQEAPA